MKIMGALFVIQIPYIKLFRNKDDRLVTLSRVATFGYPYNDIIYLPA